MHIYLTLVCGVVVSVARGQVSSENGWVLPAHDTIRVLVAFVEINYDTEQNLDAFPQGTKNWAVNELPEYRNDIFNVLPNESRKKTMTGYYEECSLGNFTVLGDYYPRIITLNHSEFGRNKGKLLREVARLIDSSEVVSSSGLELKDFDYWENAKGKGTMKVRSGNFQGVDHLMIILRNFAPIPRATGQASAGSAGLIGGFKTDSYSIFGGGDKLPFGIMRHEFNHLLIGGNNFHTGGGNSVTFRSYHFFLQGGWSMMGAANSSFLTCSAWDRYWLGWQKRDQAGLISALDEHGNSVKTDLDVKGGGGTFILRDFVTTGDAIRIKLPYIPEEEFPQWIWLENHTTSLLNDSPFDVYQYESENCISSSIPSLHLVRQISANTKEGPTTYSAVYSDYLKPLPADGAFDFQWDTASISLPFCLNSSDYIPYEMNENKENPLTGNHSLEYPLPIEPGMEKLDGKKFRNPGVLRKDEEYVRFPALGYPGQGFTIKGEEFIGIGANPSTASVLTNVNSKIKRTNRVENSDSIYLNGISIEIIQEFPDRSLKVAISFNDSALTENRRWCAPEIVLNDHNPNGADLFVSGSLVLDRGETLTRFTDPDTVQGEIFFTDKTTLVIRENAELRVQGAFELLKDSQLILKSGSQLVLDRKSRIRLEDHSLLVIQEGALVTGRGKIKIGKGAEILVDSAAQIEKLKKFVCRKKSIRSS